MFPDESRPTTLKKRYRANNKTLLRVNHLKQFSINEELQNSIIKKFLSIVDDLDFLVFSDFNYGVLTKNVISKIIKICKEKNLPYVADSQTSSQTGDVLKFIMKLFPTEKN